MNNRLWRLNTFLPRATSIGYRIESIVTWRVLWHNSLSMHKEQKGAERSLGWLYRLKKNEGILLFRSFVVSRLLGLRDICGKLRHPEKK